MFGPNAAAILNADLNGTTIHRRAITVDGIFHDLHARVADKHIQQVQIAQDYLVSLGYELSALDEQVFREFITALKTATTGPGFPEYVTEPMLLTERDFPAVYERLRSTIFYCLMRNFMGTSVNSIFCTNSSISIVIVYFRAPKA